MCCVRNIYLHRPFQCQNDNTQTILQTLFTKVHLFICIQIIAYYDQCYKRESSTLSDSDKSFICRPEFRILKKNITLRSRSDPIPKNSGLSQAGIEFRMKFSIIYHSFYKNPHSQSINLRNCNTDYDAIQYVEKKFMRSPAELRRALCFLILFFEL